MSKRKMVSRKLHIETVRYADIEITENGYEVVEHTLDRVDGWPEIPPGVKVISREERDEKVSIPADVMLDWHNRNNVND